jgi:hypothetical protein
MADAGFSNPDITFLTLSIVAIILSVIALMASAFQYSLSQRQTHLAEKQANLAEEQTALAKRQTAVAEEQHGFIKEQRAKKIDLRFRAECVHALYFAGLLPGMPPGPAKQMNATFQIRATNKGEKECPEFHYSICVPKESDDKCSIDDLEPVGVRNIRGQECIQYSGFRSETVFPTRTGDVVRVRLSNIDATKPVVVKLFYSVTHTDGRQPNKAEDFIPLQLKVVNPIDGDAQAAS